MAKKRWAWILIPAVVVALAVIGLVISSFQQEAGIITPGESGRAAVAAAAEARQALSPGAGGYEEFSAALLVALAAHRNMPVTNPAETGLDHELRSVLACLDAARRAWQAEVDGVWDPDIQGRSTYWKALYPTLIPPGDGLLTAQGVRETYGAQATGFLNKAVDLAD